MEKKQKIAETEKQFPHELIPDVLLNLPTKSLQRFLCVSKSWQSLIKAPSFVKSHFNASLNNIKHHKLVLLSDQYFTIFGCHSPTSEANPSRNKLHRSGLKMLFEVQGSWMFASFNGFLLLSDFKKDFVVLNPSTRFFKKVARYPDNCFVQFFYGMYYDHVLDDYKVLSVMEGGALYTRYFFSVYSFKTESWSKIRDFPYRVLLTDSQGVSANNVLRWVATETMYWPIIDPPIFYYHFDVILRFDMVKEKFVVLPGPEPMDEPRGKNNKFCLAAMRGNLCAYKRNFSDELEIWEMQQYGVKESWVKVYALAPSIKICWYEPLVFTKKGVVVMKNSEKDVFGYNLEDITYKAIMSIGQWMDYRVETYVESLFTISSKLCSTEAEMWK